MVASAGNPGGVGVWQNKVIITKVIVIITTIIFFIIMVIDIASDVTSLILNFLIILQWNLRILWGALGKADWWKSGLLGRLRVARWCLGVRFL